MKFDCGEERQEKLDRLGAWHDWFAWRPVKVAPHDCRWLETVERRTWPVCSWAGELWIAEYRAKEGK